MSETTSAAPAGWYDDGSGRQRWWDGAQWTERFATADDEPVDDSSNALPDDFWEDAEAPDAMGRETDEGLDGNLGPGLHAATRTGQVALNGDEFIFTKGKSTRVLDMHNVTAVRYEPATQWKIGSFSFDLFEDDAPRQKSPYLDPFTLAIAAGRGKGMRSAWDDFARAFESAVAAAQPKTRFAPTEPGERELKAAAKRETLEAKQVERAAKRNEREAKDKNLQAILGGLREQETVIRQVKTQRRKPEAGKANGTADVFGWLAVTNQRIVFEGSLLFQRDSRSFPLENVSSVDIRKELLLWFVTVTMAANVEMFGPLAQQEARALADAANSAISAARRGTAPVAAPVAAPSTADELAKFAELHKQGILTDEEFAAAKAKARGL